MAAFDFPASPSNGDTYSLNNVSYTYNGTVWKKTSAGITDGDKGDITVSDSGQTFTVDSSAITTTKIANDAVTDAKLANSINSAIAANTAKVSNATHTGDVTGATALTIADDAVTYSKIQNVSTTNRILGRDSAGAGVIEEITPANLRTMINVADGAEVNVQVDWNSSSGDSQILNKPTIPSNIGDLNNVSSSTPSTNQVLKWDGSAWSPAADSSSSGGGGDVNQNAFSNVAVSGQDTVAADSTTDTLNIAAGSNVSIATNASSDTVTISSTDTNTTYSAGSALTLTGTTFSIADDAITNAKIADNAVNTDQIVDDAVTADKLADSINTEIAANTAKVTNATHTGEVTGSGQLTIADNVVDEANLKVSNSPTDGYVLTAQSGNTGGLTWAAASSGGGGGGLVGSNNEELFVEAENQIDNSFSTTTNKNYISASPLVVASGVTLTIVSGSTMAFV